MKYKKMEIYVHSYTNGHCMTPDDIGNTFPVT